MKTHRELLGGILQNITHLLDVDKVESEIDE